MEHSSKYIVKNFSLLIPWMYFEEVIICITFYVQNHMHPHPQIQVMLSYGPNVVGIVFVSRSKFLIF